MPVRLNLAAALVEEVLKDFHDLEDRELAEIAERLKAISSRLQCDLGVTGEKSEYGRFLFARLQEIALSLEPAVVYEAGAKRHAADKGEPPCRKSLLRP